MIEPVRRKFHKPLTVEIPVPKHADSHTVDITNLKILISLSGRYSLDPFNPHVTNELSHPYQFGWAHLHFYGHQDFLFFFISFFDENQLSKQNSPRWTPLSVASHLRLFCLLMSHRKDARLIIWVNTPHMNFVQTAEAENSFSC